jgi:hypothetical protein
MAKRKIHGKIRDLAAIWRKAAPIPPTPECSSWVRSRNIAYAKGKQKAAAV